ncbi:MAG: hypothetical protein ACI3XF_02670, partial [Eubacteriales bacterium]
FNFGGEGRTVTFSDMEKLKAGGVFVHRALCSTKAGTDEPMVFVHRSGCSTSPEGRAAKYRRVKLISVSTIVRLDLLRLPAVTIASELLQRFGCFAFSEQNMIRGVLLFVTIAPPFLIYLNELI